MAKANVVNTLVVPSATKVFPYYDDFNEEKQFLRHLFRPGYAVQARELTQIQTILQNQIERFGRHIFVNGSSVIGGEINFARVATVNIATQYAGSDVTVSNFLGKTVTLSSANNQVIGQVIEVSSATSTEPPSLYINYVTGTEFGAGATIKVQSENVYANVVTTANAKSNSFYAYINDSVYFYNGYFIKVPKQTVIISKYTTNANAKVGLELDDSIVTEADDSSLLDPALESSNYQAPGAARYKAELVLAKRDLTSTDDSAFIEISRIENGVIKKNVNTPIYSEIEEVLARRTYDESGNYTVNPFVVTIDEDTQGDSANNLIVTLSAGKAYIYGLEYETISDSYIRIPKARTTANNLNYSLIANYGNYVIVDGLMGPFNTSSLGLFDIHCVPYSYANGTNTSTYSSTKIGTARVKDIEFFSGDTDVSARKHEFYFFDASFTAITDNCSSTANSTSEVVLHTVKTSSNNNAYDGATLRVNAGNAAGEIRTILSWNGMSKIATVDSAFSVTLNTSSNVSIEFDFGEAESFVQNTTYTTGGPSNANANITVLNKTGGTANTPAYVSEPTKTPLVFTYPNKFVAYSSIADQSYMYRRVYTGVQFTSGTSAAITAGSDEGFEGTSSSSNVASTVTDNFLVVVTNKQSSSRVAGEQIKVRTTISGSPEQAVFDTDGGGSDTFVATVYAKMDVAGSSATQRVKTLVKANTQTFASETAANTFIGSTGSNTSIYLDTGQVVIRNPSGVPNQKESLYISDVIAVKKIYDLNGAAVPAAGASITGYTDVTSRFNLDTGQKDEFYDHASISLKPGSRACRGPLIVCCRYYKTTTDTGYFSVDSYPSLATAITEEGTDIGTGYSLIPKYRNYSLRDCIDFRPIRQNAANTPLVYSLVGTKLPIPATDFVSDYSFYLPRYDIVVLNTNRTLSVIQGIPAAYPQYPTAPSKSMVLNTLYIEPYTDYTSNVKVRYMNTQRYTMKDIGRLEKRLEAVEYSVALTQLEKSAIDLSILDRDGLERSKYGIFVDGFTGHLLGDTNSPDYKIATDTNGRYTGDGMAIPQYMYGSVELDVVASESVNIGLDRITLGYTTEEFISQPFATKFTPVADYLYAKYEGNIYTSPESDIWRDHNNVQTVNITNVRNETHRTDYTYTGYTEQEALAWAIGEVRRFSLGPNSSYRADFSHLSDEEITSYLRSRGGSGSNWYIALGLNHDNGNVSLR